VTGADAVMGLSHMSAIGWLKYVYRPRAFIRAGEQ
jgi:hypothetical protein